MSENRSYGGDGLSATGFYYNWNISPIKDEYYSEISVTSEISFTNKKAMATPSPLTCVSSLSKNAKYWAQLFPSPPTLTEINLPDQTGKVFIVTGGNSSLGIELFRILYCKGTRVYMASRSPDKASEAIKTIPSNQAPLPPPAK